MPKGKSPAGEPERLTKPVYLSPTRVHRLKVVAARRGLTMGRLVEEYVGAANDKEFLAGERVGRRIDRAYRKAVEDEAAKFDAQGE